MAESGTGGTPLANNRQNATEPTFFATPEAFRAWLEAHHASEQELLVGFYKKGSGIPSITWPESVDGALCSAQGDAAAFAWLWRKVRRFFRSKGTWYPDQGESDDTQEEDRGPDGHTEDDLPY